MKLGKRLKQIEKMVDKPYSHIWDCCCDHGLLGFNLLKAQRSKTVHFVDIVPALLATIETKLQTHWQGKKHAWQVHCLDVAKLPLDQFSNDPKTETHLIIIAGVGGELLIELLQSLLVTVYNYHVEFILCPVHHNYQVRQFLIKQRFGLIDETLVAENGRFYEVLHVCTQSSEAITPVGSKMWNLADPKHQQYLQKTINHYQRIAKDPKADVNEILKHYQNLT